MGDAAPKRILIVEDEALIAMLLEDMLLSLGFEVVGPAHRIDKAMEIVESSALDAAILDVNVGNSRSYCVAERLKTLGIPYAFATGYGSSGIELSDSAPPVIHKPYQQVEIEAVLKDLLG
jgi:CheY-like chemotaxis protein